jgi:hypothetical protein
MSRETYQWKQENLECLMPALEIGAFGRGRHLGVMVSR